MRDVALVVVGRHDAPDALERRAVADGAAPDAQRPRLELEVVRRDGTRALRRTPRAGARR